jgi:hypothetical protein
LAIGELLNKDAEKGRLLAADVTFDWATGISGVIPESLRAAQLQCLYLEPGHTPIRDLLVDDIATQKRVTGTWPVRCRPFVSSRGLICARCD